MRQDLYVERLKGKTRQRQGRMGQSRDSEDREKQRRKADSRVSSEPGNLGEMELAGDLLGQIGELRAEL